MNLKSMLVSTAVVVVLASPIWVSHLVWRTWPRLQLNLLVVDYSVPTDSYWNHKGLFWLLNHLRIGPKQQDGLWRLERDYVGFDPVGEGKGTRLCDASLDSYEWLYLADTYGVHVRDRKPGPNTVVTNGFIFGGLSKADADALADFSKHGSIVSEFNSLSDPTPKEVRRTVADIMGIERRGWVGRFITDFQKVPEEYPWFTALYNTQYKDEPLPTGAGMMLISETGALIVLSGAVFEKSMPTLLLTPRGKEWMGIPIGTPPYYGWFGVITAKPGTDVLAEIEMPTPDDWERRFRAKGVPKRFPLMTRKTADNRQQIYISANISVVDETPTFRGLAYLPKLLAVIHRRRDSQDHGPAYWQFFVPVVGRLLTDAAEQER